MRVLGLTDGSAGMDAQVKALASAMGLPITMQRVELCAPWRLLPNAFFFLHGLLPVTRKPFPAADLIISCGRKGALVSASLKTNAQKIHIQDPQMSPGHFDVVIAMEHDHLRGENVITTPFALHDITLDKLRLAAQTWEPKFHHLPKPWHAVLIGGSTNKYRLGAAALSDLIRQIDAIGGSLLITTSRRTGEENIKALINHYGGRNNRVFLYTGELENPYLGMLACADRIYVTDDSVNMMSEALATGHPVSILPLLGHQNTKPAHFAQKLRLSGQPPHSMMQDLAKSVRLMLARRA